LVPLSVHRIKFKIIFRSVASSLKALKNTTNKKVGQRLERSKNRLEVRDQVVPKPVNKAFKISWKEKAD